MDSNPSLEYLLEMAKSVEMTPAEQEAQRRSFVYGNTAIENKLITRAMVDEQADKLKRQHAR